MVSHESLQAALRLLHHISPAIVLAYYSITQSISVCCSLQTFRSQKDKIQHKPLVVLHAAVLASYAIQATLLGFETLFDHLSNSSPDSKFYTLSSLFIWTLLTFTLHETKDNIVWYPLSGSWIAAAVTETTIFVLDILSIRNSRYAAPKPFNYIHMIVQLLRLSSIVLILLLYFHLNKAYQKEIDEESTSLLGSANTIPVEDTPLGLSTYGSIQASCSEQSKADDNEAEHDKQNQTKEEHLEAMEKSGNLIKSLKRYSVFVPILWPVEHVRLQLGILGAVGCLIAARAVILLIPRQVGIIVDSLINIPGSQITFPFLPTMLYLLYRLLASYEIAYWLEDMLWQPFKQHASQKIETAVEEKIMLLSRDFETRQSCSEIIKSMERGMIVIWLLRSVVCHMLPCFLDILLSGIYLSYVLGSDVVLILGVMAIILIWNSTYLAARRVQTQRLVLREDSREPQLLNARGWTEFSYFGGRRSQNNRLIEATALLLSAESRSAWTMFRNGLLREIVTQIGFATAFVLVIFQVVQGTQTVGSFVMTILYLLNAHSDLLYLTALDSSFSAGLIEAEKLRELLLTEESIKNGHVPIRLLNGAVLFDDISFGYDSKKPVIHNFSFSAEAGQRIALVGDTGAGKTTILRLLFRFYDVQSGKIIIDGQDIRNITLNSLREVMGVVPQDPWLFDISIMENVRYSKAEASDEEVVAACKAAALHDKILEYPEGYQAKTGEHGIRLSEGERKQIAIARVILKNPKIVLLDEGASPSESESDSMMQTALQHLMNGRTTFMIAHKLSTVKGSDVILVMKDGTIIEQGSPDELIEEDSHFSMFWNQRFGIREDAFPDKVVAKRQSKRDVPDETTVSRHVKEQSGSSFRADAPEFVPHLQNSDVSKGMHSKRKLQRSKPISKGQAVLETADARGGPSKVGPKMVHEGQRADHPPPRLNRWQRRHQARSEPHGSALGRSQADDTSKDSKPDENKTSLASRRVSGPAMYPGGDSISEHSHQVSSVVKLPSQKANRKRQRYVHGKSTEKSVSRSGATSSDASFAWSSESLEGSKPKTPLSTPNNEPRDSVEEDSHLFANPSTKGSRSNVHFATEA